MRHVADAVGPGQELRGLGRHHSAVGADIGAHVAVDVAAQAEDGAVARARDLELAVDLARVIGRHQMLAAILDPFDRAADMARRERDEEILGIELAAARRSRRRRRPRSCRWHASGSPSMGASMRRLKNRTLVAPNTDEPLLRRIPFGDLAARLQRQPGQAMTAKALLAGVLGLGESRVGVARTIPHSAPRDCCRSLRTAATCRLPPHAGPAAPAAARYRPRSLRARPRPAPGSPPPPPRSARRHSAPCPWR